MVRFLEIQGLNYCEILHRPQPSATLFCLLKKKNEGEGAPASERSSTHQWAFHIFNTEMVFTIEPANELTPHQSRIIWVLLVSF